MSDIKFEVTYKGKVYTFEYGSQVYIFQTGIYHEIELKYGIEGLLEYTELVHECYLADINRTPLGEFCDYVAARWKEMKYMSRYEILEKFYTGVRL